LHCKVKWEVGTGLAVFFAEERRRPKFANGCRYSERNFDENRQSMIGFCHAVYLLVTAGLFLVFVLGLFFVLGAPDIFLFLSLKF